MARNNPYKGEWFLGPAWFKGIVSPSPNSVKAGIFRAKKKRPGPRTRPILSKNVVLSKKGGIRKVDIKKKQVTGGME